MRRLLVVVLAGCGVGKELAQVVGDCSPSVLTPQEDWQTFEARAREEATALQGCRARAGTCEEDGLTWRYAVETSGGIERTTWYDATGRAVGLRVSTEEGCTEASTPELGGVPPSCVDPGAQWLGCEGELLCGEVATYAPDVVPLRSCAEPLPLAPADGVVATSQEVLLFQEGGLYDLEDLDGNGTLDLLLSAVGVTVGIDRSTGQPLWWFWGTQFPVALADVDGDGHRDAVWGEFNTLRWLRGPLWQADRQASGSALLDLPPDLSVPLQVVAVGDLDGVAGDELVLSPLYDNLAAAWVISPRPELDAEDRVVATLTTENGVVWATRGHPLEDYTGDGVPDLLMSPVPWSRPGVGGELLLFRGPIAGALVGEEVVYGVARLRQVGDLNLDGHADLALHTGVGWHLALGPLDPEAPIDLLGRPELATLPAMPLPVRAPGVEGVVLPVELVSTRTCWTTGGDPPAVEVPYRGAALWPLPFDGELGLPPGWRVPPVSDFGASFQASEEEAERLSVLMVDGASAVIREVCAVDPG